MRNGTNWFDFVLLSNLRLIATAAVTWIASISIKFKCKFTVHTPWTIPTTNRIPTHCWTEWNVIAFCQTDVFNAIQSMHNVRAHRATAKELVVFQFEALKSFNHTYSWRVNDSLNFHSGYVTLEIKYAHWQDMKWRFGCAFRMQTTYCKWKLSQRISHATKKKRKRKKGERTFYPVWPDDELLLQLHTSTLLWHMRSKYKLK